MEISEDQINRWANPPSETENEKCENAVRQITDVLRERFGDDVSIVRQGSHRNRTNVRLDSDVDLAVVHNGYYFPGVAGLSEQDLKRYQASRTSADYLFSQFKADVNAVLQKKFGSGRTERKNKCIRVAGNSYQVNADVVPAYEYKRFRSYDNVEAVGIAFDTDAGERICSFPAQHYENGVKKNNDTSRAYKSVVRILKNIRNYFVDKGSMKLETMPSFFIESLVWNVNENYFYGATWRDDAESITSKIWNDMRSPKQANDYAEVSNLRWLFRGQSKRNPKQAEDFMLEVWRHIKK